MKLTLVFLTICIVFANAGLKDRHSRFIKITCEKDDVHNYITKMYCFVKNYSRNISTISVGFEATKAFGDVLFDMTIGYKAITSYRQIIRITDIPLCAFLKNVESNVFIRDPFLTMQAAFPNISFKCPWSEIHLDNLSIGALNSYLLYPAGKYRNEYWFRASLGFIKLTTYTDNWAPDKIEM